MKSLVELSVCVAADCAALCGVDPSHDISTIVSRVRDEGDSYLTISLPTFCQGFERALDAGCLSPSLLPGFKFRRKACLPRFLGGFMERIFDTSGVLRESPCIRSISAVRQICLAMKRIELPCTATRQRRAERDFLNCENDLRSVSFGTPLYKTFCLVSRYVWARVCDGLPFGDPDPYLVPKHGPGRTADGLMANQKFLIGHWPTRLERVFPASSFGIGSLRNLAEGALPFPYVSPRDEVPVKVCFVPKTLKTPRVIAMEPTCMQFVQQAIANTIRRRIETCFLTRGQVNFSRQEVNQVLARLSSIDGGSATLDMKEASDRVSARLVRDMLAVVPYFREGVFACRSTRASLPSGAKIPLRKFASMGSALCFPMEAMAFFCAVVSSRIQSSGRRVSPSAVFQYSRGVFVYGDDIILPANEAPSICSDLESFGFKVNTAKSFWTGKFRESCGTDWYDGVDVKPVYFRRPIPTDRTDSKGIVSLVATANQFYNAGLWTVARKLRQLVEHILGPLPSVRDGSPVLGWISFSRGFQANGWCKWTQQLKLRGFVPTPVRYSDPLSGDAALLKCFGLIGNTDVDPQHLLESVRYGNLALKRRWTYA